MKALSLWQPWASLMAAGLKTIETRDWPTSYRGPLAIHAAKRPMDRETQALCREWIDQRTVPFDQFYRLPFGAIVAVVELFSCIPTELVLREDLLREHDFGDYGPGRFAWMTSKLRRLGEPIPYRGAQGLFEIPDVLAAACTRGAQGTLDL